jgi:radical SAM superfamily enzyme YgiQ (UPF0313 family)
MGRLPRFLLIYPPLQFSPTEMAKPDGALSLPYLAGALLRAGYETAIFDASVGTERDDLADTFYRARPLPSGLVRIGVSDDRLLAEVADWDVIGITSIFTPQTTMALHAIRTIKTAFPEKIVIAGGVNARSLLPRFLGAGADAVCLSEAEDTIVSNAHALARGDRSLDGIDGIAVRAHNGGVEVRPRREVGLDLDTLPMPAWHLLPNEKYWAISRPHGGAFPPDAHIRYAAVMTSRGCPFRCTFCHISNEGAGSPSGEIAGLRLKSVARVVSEFERLKELGAEYVFIEDDSLLARKPRIMTIFDELRALGLRLADCNGVNIVHLYRREGSRLEVDQELIAKMVEVGFESLSLAFESASPRILDKYATRKWRPGITDTAAMIRAFRAAGLHDIHGNYMIGYPDETDAEMSATVDLAREHMAAGINYVAFFVVVPYPGSQLFDVALRDGYLSPDFDPDFMKWTEACMTNTTVAPEVIRELRERAWHTVNRPEYVAYKRAMRAEHLL